MKRRSRAPATVVAALLAAQAAIAAEVEPAIDRALGRLYNFDFAGAHAILDRHIERQPGDPLGYLFRASALVFYELDRLKILESEFFKDDKKLAAELHLVPDPAIKRRLMAALDRTEELARTRLAADPGDTDALFALCLREGLLTDYHALVEQRKLRGLRSARLAEQYAQRLLRLEPTYYDAYLSSGVNEYLLSRLPFFLRWFVRIEGIQGSTERARERLELVAERGRYLGPFARILMSIIALREERGDEALRLLARLRADYPENPLIRKELAKVAETVAGGEVVTAE